MCPICSRHTLLPGVNDLLSKYPQLKDIWDYERNDSRPEERFDNTNKYYWFTCPEGHKYAATVAQIADNNFECLICHDIKFDPEANSLKALNPSLASEWSPNNNRGPETVRPTYSLSALWICPDCGGEYSASISERETGDDKCPYCNGKKILAGYNDLATTDPELTKEWSPNNEKQPSEYRKHSSEYVKWICPVCHGEYSAPIKRRESGDTACPYCNKGQLLKGFNDLATTAPELATEWSPKNTRGPDTVTKNYTCEVYWTCPTCKNDYLAIVAERFVGDESCRTCYGQNLLVGYNDLLTVKPELAKEWSSLNDREPNSVRYNQRIKMYWTCPTCHGDYLCKVSDREVADESCPYCNNGALLSGFNDLATTDPELAAEWSDTNEILPSEVKKEYVVSVKWKCPTCNGIYPARVKDRNVGDDACPYCNRHMALPGYNDLVTTDPDLAAEWSPNNERGPDTVTKQHRLNVHWICPTCHGEYSEIIDDRSVGDKSCPYCYGKTALTGYNDLATLDPELASEWSPNNDRTPDAVRRDVKVDFLWICPTCKGEYSARVGERYVGDESCPYCYGKIALIGYNDLTTTDPELAQEWSPNNSRSPDTVRKEVKSSAFWICPICKGEYSAIIAERRVGDSACPYCSNTKVLPGYNSLKVKYPHLMDEWSEIENYILDVDPDQVFPTSTKKVWWICKTCNKKYLLTIADRVLKDKRGHNPCTYCNGRRMNLPHFI